MYRCKHVGMVIVVSLFVAALFAPSAAAQAEKPPLWSVLPENALVVMWSPSPDALIKSINRFTPGPQADIPITELQEQIDDLGMPEETLNAPAALVVLARKENVKEEPYSVFLLSVDDLEAVTKPFGEPDDNGMYAVPNTVAEDDFCATVYHGYLAISNDDKAAMQALKAAGEKLYKPSDEARKLIENAQAFAHLSPAAWLDAFKKELAEARQELSKELEDGLQDEDKMADAPAFVKSMDKEALKKFVTDGYDLCLALLADIESVDVALGFDMRGLKLSSIMSVTKDGLLSRYMLPSNGIEKLDPPLPALDMFYTATWGKLDEKLAETLLADWQKVFARTLVLFPAEPDGAQPDEALDFLKKFDDVIKEGLPLMGGRFAAVGNFSENGPGIVQVNEVKDPEKLRALTAKSITIINELLGRIVPKDGDNISMKYVYESEAVTIEGVKADRFTFEIKTDDPEKQAEIDQAMAMYGPDGLSYLIAAVDGKVVTTMGEENMMLALRALRGVVGVELINTDPVIRSTVKKIGLDRDVISMFVPARVIEFFGLMVARMTGQEGNAPMPLPFATPAALGMKVLDESTLRCDGYVPQACVAECMTAVMGLTGMMGGFFGGQMNVPPPGVMAPAAVPPAPPPNDAPMW